MSVTLLGPQRFRVSARTVVRNLDAAGPIATVNAGWQEREADDAELDEVLGGRMRNLHLYRRWEHVLEVDPEYAEASRLHNETLDEQQSLYALRLKHAGEAVTAVWRRGGSSRLVHDALESALAEIRALDDWHLGTVDRLEAEFASTYTPPDRLIVAEHRAEVAHLLSDAVALVVTGGHVGVVLRCLQLFLGTPDPDLPVVAWSAGAMALAERVVLFNDVSVEGPAPAEVYRRGLGLYRGVVPLPHARRRLHLTDQVRVAALARRFADECCLILDDGAQVPLPSDGGCPPGFPVLTAAGHIATSEAA